MSPERHRDDGLHRQQLADFRLMAAHPDIVEEVIANSTDKAPASRRKVVAAIKQRLGTTPVPRHGDHPERLATAALRFWVKMHNEGLCRHRDGDAWAECEALADELAWDPETS
jgi:hypothetical protein